LLPGKAADPGRSGTDNRLFVKGCLWVLRSGAHGWDLAALWQVEARGPTLQPLVPCRRLGAGVRCTDRRMGQAVSDDQRHHRPCAPVDGDRTSGGCDQALGRSRDGLTINSHMLADTPGGRHDSRPDRRCHPGARLAAWSGRRCGCRWQGLWQRSPTSHGCGHGRGCGHPIKAWPRGPISRDATSYEPRNRLERCFGRLMHVSRIATPLRPPDHPLQRLRTSRCRHDLAARI
jgi:transposase